MSYNPYMEMDDQQLLHEYALLIAQKNCQAITENAKTAAATDTLKTNSTFNKTQSNGSSEDEGKEQTANEQQKEPLLSHALYVNTNITTDFELQTADSQAITCTRRKITYLEVGHPLFKAILEDDRLVQIRDIHKIYEQFIPDADFAINSKDEKKCSFFYTSATNFKEWTKSVKTITLAGEFSGDTLINITNSLNKVTVFHLQNIRINTHTLQLSHWLALLSDVVMIKITAGCFANSTFYQDCCSTAKWMTTNPLKGRSVTLFTQGMCGPDAFSHLVSEFIHTLPLDNTLNVATTSPLYTSIYSLLTERYGYAPGPLQMDSVMKAGLRQTFLYLKKIKPEKYFKERFFCGLLDQDGRIMSDFMTLSDDESPPFIEGYTPADAISLQDYLSFTQKHPEEQMEESHLPHTKLDAGVITPSKLTNVKIAEDAEKAAHEENKFVIYASQSNQSNASQNYVDDIQISQEPVQSFTQTICEKDNSSLFVKHIRFTQLHHIIEFQNGIAITATEDETHQMLNKAQAAPSFVLTSASNLLKDSSNYFTTHFWESCVKVTLKGKWNAAALKSITQTFPPNLEAFLMRRLTVDSDFELSTALTKLKKLCYLNVDCRLFCTNDFVSNVTQLSQLFENCILESIYLNVTGFPSTLSQFTQLQDTIQTLMKEKSCATIFTEEHIDDFIFTMILQKSNYKFAGKGTCEISRHPYSIKIYDLFEKTHLDGSIVTIGFLHRS